MDFIQRIKQGIDRSITTVGVRSKEMLETQKIKGRIGRLEVKRKVALEELGDIVYTMFQESGYESLTMEKEELKLDDWESSIFGVLNDICEGKLKDDLVEESNKQFKITATKLYKRVKERVPGINKRPQSLGRAVSKFDLITNKYIKRIEGERETVYVFDREDLISLLAKVDLPKDEKPVSKSRLSEFQQPYEDRIRDKCEEVQSLDKQITELEDEIEQIRKKAKKEIAEKT